MILLFYERIKYSLRIPIHGTNYYYLFARCHKDTPARLNERPELKARIIKKIIFNEITKKVGEVKLIRTHFFGERQPAINFTLEDKK